MSLWTSKMSENRMDSRGEEGVEALMSICTGVFAPRANPGHDKACPCYEAEMGKRKKLRPSHAVDVR